MPLVLRETWRGKDGTECVLDEGELRLKASVHRVAVPKRLRRRTKQALGPQCLAGGASLERGEGGVLGTIVVQMATPVGGAPAPSAPSPPRKDDTERAQVRSRLLEGLERRGESAMTLQKRYALPSRMPTMPRVIIRGKLLEHERDKSIAIFPEIEDDEGMFDDDDEVIEDSAGSSEGDLGNEEEPSELRKMPRPSTRSTRKTACWSQGMPQFSLLVDGREVALQ